jgi:hypothetical protein
MTYVVGLPNQFKQTRRSINEIPVGGMAHTILQCHWTIIVRKAASLYSLPGKLTEAS